MTFGYGECKLIEILYKESRDQIKCLYLLWCELTTDWATPRWLELMVDLGFGDLNNRLAQPFEFVVQACVIVALMVDQRLGSYYLNSLRSMFDLYLDWIRPLKNYMFINTGNLFIYLWKKLPVPEALCAPWFKYFCACIGCMLPIAFMPGFVLTPLTPIAFNKFGLLFCKKKD